VHEHGAGDVRKLHKGRGAAGALDHLHLPAGGVQAVKGVKPCQGRKSEVCGPRVRLRAGSAGVDRAGAAHGTAPAGARRAMGEGGTAGGISPVRPAADAWCVCKRGCAAPVPGLAAHQGAELGLVHIVPQVAAGGGAW
jgi:hypothetical protein